MLRYAISPNCTAEGHPRDLAAWVPPHPGGETLNRLPSGSAGRVSDRMVAFSMAT